MADASASAALPSAGDAGACVELDVFLGVPLATARQAAAWELLRCHEAAHRLQAAWHRWRAACAHTDAHSGSGGESACSAGDEASPAREAEQEEEASAVAAGTRVALFAAARRLRCLARCVRCLAAHAWLQREVWRRGHRALMARDGACVAPRWLQNL
jgi:hypothetical protein